MISVIVHPDLGAVSHAAQVNPPELHPASVELAPRDPVSTFTATKARSTRFEPHAVQVGVAPSE